jgi:PAS domain S-box-containing protein
MLHNCILPLFVAADVSFGEWLYVIGYLFIWIACLLIPFLVRRYIFRQLVDPAYVRVYYLFAAFIFFAGLTFLVDAIGVLTPISGIKTITSVITGCITWTTVFYLVKFLPIAFSKKLASRRKHQKNEERFRLLIEEVKNYAIFMIDMDGAVVSWNKGAEAITGYTSKEIINRHFSIFYTAEEIDRGEPGLALRIARESGRFGKEVKHLRKNHEEFWANIVVTPLYDNKNLYGYSVVTRDVTDRKIMQENINKLNDELEKKVDQKTREVIAHAEKLQKLNNELEDRVTQRTKELKEANKELEAFSYSVSHDLRAPLRIMDGYANILLEDYAARLDEEGKEALQVIVNNSQKMGKLIDALLKLSQLGRKELLVKKIDMQAMLNGVVKEQSFRKEEHIQIKSGNLLPAMGDPDLVEHVWSNLVSNAIKYSSQQEHPVIEINSERKDGRIIYSVKDNGVGFNMKYAHKLFGVFQRLHKVSEFEGTGIGLALVQRIITRNGGEVWAESEENKGATFYFTLTEATEPISSAH